MKKAKQSGVRASLATRILCWILVVMMLAGGFTTIIWGIQTLLA